MNLIQLAPQWLVIVLCALLLLAAVEDFIRLRISNLTSLAVFVAGLVAVTVQGWSIDIWQNLLVSMVILLAGTALFAAGKMGGGDVKLFAAVAFWSDLQGALILIPAILIAGGLLALIVLSRRWIFKTAGGVSKQTQGKGVPYGVAIAIGTFFVVAYQMQIRANPYDRLAHTRVIWAPGPTQ